MKRLLAGTLIALTLSSVPLHAFYYNDQGFRRAYHEYCEFAWTRLGAWVASISGC